MSYSPYFKTLMDSHSETVFGRGTHMSILSSKKPSKLGFEHSSVGVVWDEDHDERVIQVLEILYAYDLLEDVLFIGERKGMLTIVTGIDDHDISFEFIEGAIEKTIGDYWPVTIGCIWLDDACSEINDSIMCELVGSGSGALSANYVYNTGLAYDVFNNVIINDYIKLD